MKIGFIVLLMLAVGSCNFNSESKKEILINSLKNLEGEFIKDASTEKIYFNKSEELKKILNDYPDKTELIGALIDNFDNMETAKSVYQNEKLKVGNICYQAIKQTIYYEYHDETGDIIAWKGHIKPIAPPPLLKEAKKEWKRVFKNKQYIFL